MIMMNYIIAFLTFSDSLSDMSGGDQIKMMLNLGCYVIGAFSVIFLFYTNSFLIKKRKKELGLYNIYGRIGGNLNQIARTLNEWHSPYPQLAGEVRAAVSDHTRHHFLFPNQEQSV